MFLQETPVLTDGTLMEQIIYPDHVPLRSTSRDSLISRDLNMKENSCKEVLRSVGLDYLILDLHRPARWETILRPVFSFIRALQSSIRKLVKVVAKNKKLHLLESLFSDQKLYFWMNHLPPCR